MFTEQIGSLGFEVVVAGMIHQYKSSYVVEKKIAELFRDNAITGTESRGLYAALERWRGRRDYKPNKQLRLLFPEPVDTGVQ